MSRRICIRPATLVEANAKVLAWHRHHKEVRVHRFSLAAEYKGREVLGVSIIANPVASALQDGRTFEVRRLATPGLKADRRCWGFASALLTAAWRAAWAMGVRRMISYTRVDEPGYCYEVAGWRQAAVVEGREWNTGNKAQRWLNGLYEPTTEIIDRVRWEAPSLETP